MAAYCRVSTKQEEQLNSYEVQRKFYTEKINSEPKWKLAGIFADKGITGTSTKNRTEFNKMIRKCKAKKIDMIITKSISRFARNTLDCLKYIRMLKQLGIDVFFEEQGLHSIDPGAEFYITIYGSIAQSESENISANVRWGKEQSAREGKVVFHYKNFMGYKKGEDGTPVIVPEEAEIITRIFKMYLEGASEKYIADTLTKENILTPTKNNIWNHNTVRNILKNEKYKGDSIINKTYVTDCISKKTKVNNGERPKFYVENSHPAIIDKQIFDKVQEEMARRTSKRKVKQVGTKTEQGKYSSKYALTELLFCGECGTPYRRVTWTVKGKKKIVWRCINRLDYGKKYCKNSPSIEENALQSAIMRAISESATENIEVLDVLKQHIAMGLMVEEDNIDNSLEYQIRLNDLNKQYNELLGKIKFGDENTSNIEQMLEQVIKEKREIQNRLDQYKKQQESVKKAKSRLDEIYDVIDILKNHPMSYDDYIVRQVIDCIKVIDVNTIQIMLKSGNVVIAKLSMQCN